MSIQGHFVSSKQGRVFVSQFGCQSGDTAILCLPSITEELNLARAVLAKQCQAFALEGVDSFIMDYYGCGDSEGEFEHASADNWLDDVLSVGYWLIAKGYSKLILLGVRTGGLLLGANQRTLHDELPIKGQMLWKPVANGKLFVTQLMRIKQANQMMSDNPDKVNYRNEILSGNSTEVAGYLITKDFIKQLESLNLTPDTRWLVSTHWFELAATSLTPITKRLTSDADNVTTHLLSTPPFWQVPEVFDLPELTSLGLSVLAELSD